MILLLGGFLRSFHLGRNLLIDDEWHALNVVQDHGAAFIFSHFGHADYSIPLALYYEALQHTLGLSEWSMRLPSVIAGVALIAVFPMLLRPWLNRRERLLTAGLLAISPFLVYFSRIARPYALIALLAGASLPLAWRWWRRSERRSGVAWAACAVAAGWLNPVSLAVTTAPFLWFVPAALARALGDRHWQSLRGAGSLALAIALPLGALLAQPLGNDLASLAAKAGVHEMTPGTIVVMARLFSGSGHALVVALVAALAVTGWLRLRRRDREFAGFLVLVTGAALIAVWLTGAQWIHQGLVPARYLIGLLPVYLALSAIGLNGLFGLARRAWSMPPVARPLLGAAALAVLFLLGPIPSWNLGSSQFSHHLMHQFDYRAEGNDFRRALAPVRPEPFYEEIAALHPGGDAVVVEAPWYLESHWNPLPIYQRVHGQRVMAGFVGGVCAGRLYGELRSDAPGFEFENFIRLERLLEQPRRADYLVLRRTGVTGARGIDFDFERCAVAARTAFGAPWRETPDALVFRLDGDA